MAFTSTLATAQASLTNLLQLTTNVTFDDLTSTPTSSINWLSGLALPNARLNSAAGTPSQSNPIEVASTEGWGELITASGVAHTLDLAALPRSPELGDLDLTGLKVQGFLAACPYTNTDDVSLTVGASNGYNMQDNPNFFVSIAPGGVEFCLYPENTGASVQMPDVGPTAKELDFGSGMTNFQIQFAVFAG